MRTDHFVRVLKYGLLEPVLSLAVKYANPLFGAPGSVVPPNWMNYAGGGDFAAIGRANVALLKSHGVLKAHDRVLEIGCGICRNAAYLPEHIPDGHYEGFDVVRTGIYWGKQRISRDNPNFRFCRVDVHNGFYNPFGKIEPTSFDFPYEAASFDLAFAFSVFTHMLRDETAAYVKQCQRVLAPGGRLLFTAFVLDERAEKGIAQGRASFRFTERHRDTLVETA